MTGDSQRIFQRRHLWRLTRAAYQAGVELLTQAASDRLGEIAAVVGIAQGGRAPAYAISARAQIPTVIVSARHNLSDDTYAQATGHVQCNLAPLRQFADRPGPFLVVDDICGTGATLAAVTDALTHIAVPGAVVCTATLCRNAGAPAGVPDLYVWDVADWVVFPWERLRGAGRMTPLPTPTKAQTS
ncbi:hypothetical protein SAMN04489712_14114 [Thermomonospora echinospora]|uniref:Phosphoribosyltransferase domain-containing protein n=1 Tax=Thermomonospora echinospora TaxID=1992 RepID=A0A1H6E9T6_9ACTN|nr:phosphoribosyltransferase family protein [Thermomonospora echinospora]SEG93869.1 hypothetical protein SAMN04489712_14114 [Thermomonospora echinospora]